MMVQFTALKRFTAEAQRYRGKVSMIQSRQGEPIWKEWVKKMESKGRPEAQQVLNATLEMLK
jgi:hypothetical protein